MRKVTLGLANSLDNYIARLDGGVDWLRWTREIADFSGRFMKTIDTILIGRKTFEVMLKFGQTSYPGKQNYVFSRSAGKRRSLKKSLANKGRNVEIINDDAVQFVAALKKSLGKGICLFGGGELAKSLFEADLIDELTLNIHPVLLGSGIPLFHEMEKQIDLKLINCKKLERGNLIVTYQVKR